MSNKTLLWILTALVFGAILAITIAPGLITTHDETARTQQPTTR
ncbi:hypothetical protein [Mesorhizobium sp. L-8-10]|nr:hypothetical protein [Mesorhizobium sp. L-8-10]